MATWQPKSDEAVGKNEPLGRRLFDEPMLAGANEATSYDGLDLRNFEETRGREFSLDRLGRSGVDNRVSYLLPRAHAAAAKFAVAKTFNGWAVLRTHKLINPPKGARLPVVASPIAGDGLAENLYHAHAILPEGGDAASYSSALHLRFLFAKYGRMHPVRHDTSRTITRSSWLLAKLKRFARAAIDWYHSA